MNHLSTVESAGQVIVAGFGAGEPPESLCELARTGALGGFVLFRRNLGEPGEVVELTQLLRSLAPPERPLWIAVDQEGGRVARLRQPVLSLPPMRVLGAIDQPELTERAGRILGEQLALLGFNLDFAPVLDVDTNPKNPVIGDRSFGADPARVIRHARAFAAGLASAGIASCGKHFPGHGDTHVDSHLALPRTSQPRQRIDTIELAPFAALPELPCMMTAHVLFDVLDPAVPATLSRAIIHDLLRNELGYEGLVFSDDLEMKAVADPYGVPEAACRAIAAGCDQVLICAQPKLVLEAHRALVERAEREASFAARLQDAAARSLRVRAQFPARPRTNEPILQLLAATGGSELETQIDAAWSSLA
jgi:beta-N-acetylhexosaminidase